MFYSSVGSTSLWFTTTRCSGGGCPITPSTRTTLPGCLFRRRRPWLSVPCLLRFRPARALRGTFAPVMRVSSKDTTSPRPEAQDSSSGRSCSCAGIDDSGSGCPGDGGSYSMRLIYLFCLSRLRCKTSDVHRWFARLISSSLGCSPSG